MRPLPTPLAATPQVGSTAWVRSAWAVHEQQSAALLRAAWELAPPSERGPPPDDAAVAAAAAAANGALSWHDDPRAVQYLIREPMPLPYERHRPGSASQPAPAPPHGFARRVRVRPHGWNHVSCLDGLAPSQLPMSCTLSFEIEPDQNLWLRTARFK